MSDYHLHLHPHADDDRPGPPVGEYPAGHIEAYVETLMRRGGGELGFTEHLYRCAEAQPVLGRFWEDGTDPDTAKFTEEMVRTDQGLSLEGYVTEIVAAKERGLPVKLGLEVDFFPETIDAVLELIAPYPWDFLIGSVHWVGGWSVDSEGSTVEFERRGIDTAWEQYFALEAELAASGSVDVLAHVDVVKKYGYRPVSEPLELYASVIEAAVSSGMAVEVSSQGLRKPVGEIYPSPIFLRMFQEAGVPITLASDGHRPEEAGYAHDQVVSAARDAGYTAKLHFDRRSPTEIVL
ncbi:MAG: histidinol-phosphatase HisJ family protein [Acidimicrobiia bacterium]|nr:histidinol-phosphatase HisJ family protein [Acidimicrobiia bacterium]